MQSFNHQPSIISHHPPRYPDALLREDLASLVTSAIDRLVESGALPGAVRGPVEIIDTRQPEHGDFACNFALTAAKRAGMNPRDLAAKLQSCLTVPAESAELGPVARATLIDSVEIAGPGFLNFRLNPEAVAAHLPGVLELGEDLPKSEIQNLRSKINVEFVSVNPNGPITVGSGRGAAYGDTLCRVLETAGHQVHREYYVNDGVNSEQMRLFAESVRHYYGAFEEASFPERGYRGEYVADVASRVLELHGGSHEDDETKWFQSRSQDLMLERQREDLHAFGVDFDTWFSEQSLHDSGEVTKCVDELVAKGVADEEPHRIVLKMARGGVIESVERVEQATDVEEEDDVHGEVAGSAGVPPAPELPTEGSAINRAVESADESAHSKTLWLRSTKFGDDMDRVLRRRDGRLTYIASDVAYHKDKLTDGSRTRGTGPVDKLITILGPDHHGYIHRLQAVLAALLEGEAVSGKRLAVGGSGISTPQPPSSLTSQSEEWGSEIERQIFRSPEERDACRAALEEGRRRLEVVIFQIVRFVKDGKPAPMRKRDGNIYELRDLINEVGQTVAPSGSREEQQRVGADVARFFYLMRSHDTAMDFDIDLATKQSDDNPVFYVQYAHARICSVLRRATEAGIGVLRYQGTGHSDAPRVEVRTPNAEANTPIPQHPITSLLSHPREQALIRKILDLPMEVARCAEDYEVHRLTTYAVELARTYHHFYDACRVILPDQPELSKARLALCESARIALKATLDLVGVSAPERMERGADDGVMG